MVLKETDALLMQSQKNVLMVVDLPKKFEKKDNRVYDFLNN